MQDKAPVESSTIVMRMEKGSKPSGSNQNGGRSIGPNTGNNQNGNEERTSTSTNVTDNVGHNRNIQGGKQKIEDVTIDFYHVKNNPASDENNRETLTFVGYNCNEGGKGKQTAGKVTIIMYEKGNRFCARSNQNGNEEEEAAAGKIGVEGGNPLCPICAAIGENFLCGICNKNEEEEGNPLCPTCASINSLCGICKHRNENEEEEEEEEVAGIVGVEGGNPCCNNRNENKEDEEEWNTNCNNRNGNEEEEATVIIHVGRNRNFEDGEQIIGNVTISICWCRVITVRSMSVMVGYNLNFFGTQFQGDVTACLMCP